MSSPTVRYVFALIRAFARDTSSGGRDRTVILGTDGSEVSWDGDRMVVASDDDPDEPNPWVRHGAAWCERHVVRRFGAMAVAEALAVPS